jgi:hypothetical protein
LLRWNHNKRQKFKKETTLIAMGVASLHGSRKIRKQDPGS